MKTFEKEYGKYVVTFKNENEYIEMGSLEKNPKFEGLLIREKFSSNQVEFYPEQIEFFLKELESIPHLEKYDTENKKPLIKFIHQYDWNGYSSNFCIIIATYDGLYCKFFMDVSHQMVLIFPIIRNDSPEFPIDIIIKIFKDAEIQMQPKKRGK